MELILSSETSSSPRTIQRYNPGCHTLHHVILNDISLCHLLNQINSVLIFFIEFWSLLILSSHLFWSSGRSFPLPTIYITRVEGWVDRVCCLVVRLPGCRLRGPGFDSPRCQIFWVAVGLDRGTLSPCENKWGATWKRSSGSGLENWE
jgi:hypothetical protein